MDGKVQNDVLNCVGSARAGFYALPCALGLAVCQCAVASEFSVLREKSELQKPALSSIKASLSL